jgi:hypothetical protein
MFVQHTLDDRDMAGVLRKISRAINTPDLAKTLTLTEKDTVVTYPMTPDKQVRVTLSRPLKAGTPAITPADVKKIEVDIDPKPLPRAELPKTTVAPPTARK